MKKAITLFLALVLALAFVPAVSAASGEASDAAWALHELGLFEGAGSLPGGMPDFALDRAPTRSEAVTMLVRLLGKEQEALSGKWTTPFTDVADWAMPYVGYAYVNCLTYGVGANTFGANTPVSAAEYLSFVLRALGYSSDTDFQWDKAWELSDKLGVTDGRYDENTKRFTRGDVAIVSNNALNVPRKGGDATLLSALGKTRSAFDPDNPTLADLHGVWKKDLDPKDGENCIAFYDEIMVGAYSVSANGREELGISCYNVADGLSDGELSRHLLYRRTAALDAANGVADTVAFDYEEGGRLLVDRIRLRMPDKDTLCYSIGTKNPKKASEWDWGEELTFRRVESSDLFDRVEAQLKLAPQKAIDILQGAWYLKTTEEDRYDPDVRVEVESEAFVNGNRAEYAQRRTGVDAETGAVKYEIMIYASGALVVQDDALVFSGRETRLDTDDTGEPRSAGFDDHIFELEEITLREGTARSASPAHGLLASVRSAIG